MEVRLNRDKMSWFGSVWLGPSLDYPNIYRIEDFLRPLFFYVMVTTV